VQTPLAVVGGGYGCGDRLALENSRPLVVGAACWRSVTCAADVTKVARAARAIVQLEAT
jgi:hypothetical protein